MVPTGINHVAVHSIQYTATQQTLMMHKGSSAAVTNHMQVHYTHNTATVEPMGRNYVALHNEISIQLKAAAVPLGHKSCSSTQHTIYRVAAMHRLCDSTQHTISHSSAIGTNHAAINRIQYKVEK